MRIKRYFSSNVRQAIRQIRDELGPDAVILSNRKVDGGVEIAAAIDYDDAWVRGESARTTAAPSAVPAPSKALPKPEVHESRGAAEPWGSAWQDDIRQTEPDGPALEMMGRELSSLRGLLEQQLSGLAWGELARRHPVRASAFRQLMDLGLSQSLAQGICEEITDDISDPRTAWRRALGVLAHHLRVTDGDILSDGGVVALLGPTGVGKTTSIAKLAARFALRHGAHEVALITTDSYRVGAHEQLRTFAQIMGIPVRVASDVGELRSALEHFCERRLLLIDTAGISQRDVRFSKQIALVHEGSPLVKTFLVLSCTAQYLALEEAVRAFSGTKIDGCVITKTDESTNLGAVLSIMCQHEIPAAYVSNGQRVPEDISSARAHLLVTRAVTIAQQRAAANIEGRNVYGGLEANARH